MGQLQAVLNEEKDIVKTYQELHRLAEPSWREKQTSAYIKEFLENAGFFVQTFQEHFGLVAEIKGKTETVIAFRADMDALMQEVDGVVCANHSCGHDAHSTIALFTAISLMERRRKPQHTIRFIFQPAEETAGGALQMTKDGALKDVVFLAGLHLRPAFEVSLGQAAPMISHGSTIRISGTIKGVPAHAARPEEGNNPIEALAELVQQMKNVKLDTKVTYSIKMTMMHAGEAANSIPGSATFTFDLRAATNEVMNTLIEKAKVVINSVALYTATSIDVKEEAYSPAAIANEKAIEIAASAIAATLGKENVAPICTSPGAEDFHFYTLKNPNIVATMIGLGCDLTPGLHHPDMRFNTDALKDGVKIVTQLLTDADQLNW